jgi:hypothetical protein
MIFDAAFTRTSEVELKTWAKLAQFAKTTQAPPTRNILSHR